MLKNILLAVAVLAFLTSNLQAQSSSKSGTAYNGSSSSSAAAKKARLMEKEVDKMVGKITRTDFAGIKLNKDQRGMLESLTTTNFQQITNLTNQIGQMIPRDQLSKLQRTYKNEIRDGKSEKDSMVMGMNKIGLPATTQEKILMIADSKMEIMNKITMGVKETLTTEQTAMLAEKMAMKEKEAMEKKQTVTSGSGTN